MSPLEDDKGSVYKLSLLIYLITNLAIIFLMFTNGFLTDSAKKDMAKSRPISANICGIRAVNWITHFVYALSYQYSSGDPDSLRAKTAKATIQKSV